MSLIVDIDPAPGNPTSLLRTFVGLYVRDLGGWIRVADLLDLLAAAGVSNTSARSAVSRLKDKGLLIGEKRETTGRPSGAGSAGSNTAVAGYRLDPAVVTDLERGDRRIFSYRGQQDDEPWCLVSYSLPEVDRSKRVQLRRALVGLGFGAVTDGLWIAPGHLRTEAEDALETLEVRERATIFVTETPLTAEPFAEAAAKWWELDALAARHTDFISRYERFAQTSRLEPRAAFDLWLRCVDDWKTIPYIDPGLPASALPRDWPGMRSVELFAQLRATYSGLAHAHVRDVTAGS